MTFGLIISAIFGAIFGSYATLFAYRLPLKESCFGRYFGPKSRCPKCGRIIKTSELIPIINWLITLGKCRGCNAKIPRTHLFIELSTCILFILTYIKFGFSEQFILYCLIATTLVIISVTDYTHQIFPDSALNFITTIGVAARILNDHNILDLIYSISFGIVCAIIFYKIFYVKITNIFSSKEQVFGYAKLILIISIIIQPQLFFIYFLVILINCAIFSLLKIKNKTKTKSFGYVFIIPLLFLIYYPPNILI